MCESVSVLERLVKMNLYDSEKVKVKDCDFFESYCNHLRGLGFVSQGEVFVRGSACIDPRQVFLWSVNGEDVLVNTLGNMNFFGKKDSVIFDESLDRVLRKNLRIGLGVEGEVPDCSIIVGKVLRFARIHGRTSDLGLSIDSEISRLNIVGSRAERFYVYSVLFKICWYGMAGYLNDKRVVHFLDLSCFVNWLPQDVLPSEALSVFEYWLDIPSPTRETFKTMWKIQDLAGHDEGDDLVKVVSLYCMLRVFMNKLNYESMGDFLKIVKRISGIKDCSKLFFSTEDFPEVLIAEGVYKLCKQNGVGLVVYLRVVRVMFGFDIEKHGTIMREWIEAGGGIYNVLMGLRKWGKQMEVESFGDVNFKKGIMKKCFGFFSWISCHFPKPKCE